MDFSYFMPTRIISGRDCVKKNAGAMAGLGKKALVVTGAHSAANNGSLKDVLAALKKNGQQSAVFDKVVPNPPVSCAREGAELAKSEKADFIVAVGGGSAMDAGKAIAAMACREIEDGELFSADYSDGVLPVVCVPTTAGTGSEVTKVAVLTCPWLETKCSMGGSALFPAVSYLDGKYMETLGHATTVNTAVDALTHAVEGMLSTGASPITDMLGAESIGIISARFRGMKEDTLTGLDRDMLLYASTLAGMVIANTGTNVVHAMGYSLTYYRNIDHGRANGLLFAEYMAFVNKYAPERASYVLRLMGCANAEELAVKMRQLLGEPDNVTVGEAEKFTEKVLATKAGNLAKCIACPNEREVARIYKNSFELI